MKRRILSILLAAAMLCALLPAAFLTASADIILPPDPFDDIVSGTCGESVKWELNKTSGVLTVTGTGEMTSSPWLDYSGSIRTATVANGVTGICSGAFQLCTRLTAVAISDSVKSIGSSAFAGCSGLTGVTIPEGVTSIGKDAFNGCEKLTAVTIPDSVTSLGDWAFYRCSGLTSVTIGSGLTGIGSYVFAYCGALTSVTIPESVTSIGQAAFLDCFKLTDVFYGGIEAKWNKITVGEMNECLTGAEIHCAPCLHPHTHSEHADATCTEPGYDRTVCDDCGETVSETAIPALGHDIVMLGEVPATCLEAGLTAGEYCTRCDYRLEQENVPALGHDWDDGVITVEPTETTPGEKTFTCKRCGETRKEYVPELSHVHSYTATVTAPTCTEQGYTTYTCVCGDSYVADYVAALGHDLVVDAAKPATCTETGLTEGSHCARCDYKVAQEVVPMLPHSYVDGVCTVCGAKDPGYKPPVTQNPFKDVKAEDYYYDAVIWAVGNEPQITNGTSATTFSPNAACTRGQVVTFLWRANGCPEPKRSDNPFKDVKESDYYYKAVLWAAENGVTTGTSATTFSPNAPCTRAHVVTFLWRAGGEPQPKSTANPFKDVKTGEYYTTAVLWAVSHEPQITNGTGATTFSPNATCTRGQIVTFLYRAMAE
ncbi:MAG: leucine-rich repeat protein [Oscillospiraceae bacterium]|nr:leucine-rich repeat protein [Oscillospiraceae bacterium]